jgi:carbonic anhydrase/acetyltransferase-like protein (isoleucine patch superfamily)
MGATLLDKAVIGEYSIVAAGSVVSPNKVFPPRSMIMGVPAKVVRALNEKEIEMLNLHYKSYVKYASEFNDEEIVKRL